MQKVQCTRGMNIDEIRIGFCHFCSASQTEMISFIQWYTALFKYINECVLGTCNERLYVEKMCYDVYTSSW